MIKAFSALFRTAYAEQQQQPTSGDSSSNNNNNDTIAAATAAAERTDHQSVVTRAPGYRLPFVPRFLDPLVPGSIRGMQLVAVQIVTRHGYRSSAFTSPALIDRWECNTHAVVQRLLWSHGDGEGLDNVESSSSTSKSSYRFHPHSHLDDDHQKHHSSFPSVTESELVEHSLPINALYKQQFVPVQDFKPGITYIVIDRARRYASIG
jgi:hypothetical protein